MSQKLDPFVFYRGFSASSPVTTGAEHLSAAATRLAFSIVYAITELPEAVWLEFKRLLTVETLWGLCIVVAGWLVATVIGGPVGAAINAALLAYGLYELWPVVKAVFGDLWLWLKTSYYAETEADLKKAGKYFADALAKGALTTIEAIVTHRVFTRASRGLRERWATPEWLKRMYQEAEATRNERTRKQRRAAEEESQRRRALEEVNRKLGAAASTVMVPAGQGVGDMGVAGVLGGLAVVAVLGITTAALVSQRKGRQ